MSSVLDASFAERLSDLYSYVRKLVDERQQHDPDFDDPYKGLYVSDAQASDTADRLNESVGRDFTKRTFGDWPASGRLGAFAQSFGLDALDLDIITTVAAPDLDPRVEKLYGYLHDDLTRRRASVGLALELTGRSSHDAIARARFAAHAGLVRHGLVVISDADRPLLTRSLRLHDRVLAHLLGDDSMPSELSTLELPSVEIEHPQISILEATLRAQPGLVHLRDDSRGGGAAVAASVLMRLGIDAFTIDLGRTENRGADFEDADALVAAAILEAKLRGAGLVVLWVDSDPSADSMRRLAEAEWPMFVITRHPWDPRWSSKPVVSELTERIPAGSSESIWQSNLSGMDPEEVGSATRQLRLRPDQIVASTRLASVLAKRGDRALAVSDVESAARAQNSAGLERLSRRIRPAVTWDDLVVPSALGEQLQMVESRYRYRDVVLEQWRFGGKNNRRMGVVALFAGASGVGKTMAAEALAGSLGLDLYQVNLATVVDKYIGETEKNLERIFVAAESVNCVLFFDEADALFGKRSEVSDAKDRYANVEVAYLLQRLETFEGLAILATNLRTNIDDAFTRRLDVLVDFPEPDEEQRFILWERCLGTFVERSDDLDVSFLAAQFEVAGGNIRNISIAAAFLAAQRDSIITMQDVITATADEYRKLGRLCTRTEFGHWIDFLHRED